MSNLYTNVTNQDVYKTELYTDIILTELTIKSLDIPRDFLVREEKKNLMVHTSNTSIEHMNIYAKKSLEMDNEARCRSKDEAISIHIITSKLNTKLRILYESQLKEFYGKPDFIIKLGKKLYIIVSTTRAVNKRSEFNQSDSNRLIKKKITGLQLYADNLECFINDTIDDGYLIRPILHVLSPSIENTNMCMKSYNNINKKGIENIKIIISLVTNHKELL